MLKPDKPENKSVIRIYVASLMLAWTLVLVASFVFNWVRGSRNYQELARIEARMSFWKDLDIREWVARYSGVYVPITAETPPNPYLAGLFERDITTPSGRQLTLINPAYVTRLLHELSKENHGIIAHITSLKPIRPENAADEWETEALKSFERGETERSSLVTMGNEERMRLMRPLIAERECLQCHAKQGYKEGEIRGGISVAVPMKPLWAIFHHSMIDTGLVHLFIWLLGIGGIYYGGLLVVRSEKQTALLLDKIQNEAMVDELTGLYNLRGFLTMAEKQLSLVRQLRQVMLLFFVDLDKMKWINDFFGHHEGDKALKTAAEILKSTFREADIIARVGGDEFVVLLLQSAGLTEELLNSRLLSEINDFNDKKTLRYEISLSTGLSRYDTENQYSLGELLRRADRQMYEQKRAKKLLRE